VRSPPFRFALLTLFAAALFGCVPVPSEPAAPSPPSSLIIVRDFRVTSATRVSIDTSFGFNLQRGEPGVPLRKRAASVSRGVAFVIADALTERLRQLGYPAVHAEAGNPDPKTKAIIVIGTLRRIDEGHRRRVGTETAGVAAEVEIDNWAPGMQPLAAFHVDSAQLGNDGGDSSGASAVNIAAARVGRELARSVAAAARRVNLPGMR
jgi:hypothetical protein